MKAFSFVGRDFTRIWVSIPQRIQGAMILSPLVSLLDLAMIGSPLNAMTLFLLSEAACVTTYALLRDFKAFFQNLAFRRN
jgi:hypothetical protein